VIIPAYEAGTTLPGVIAGLAPHFAPNEILVIDDGSRDDTAGKAESAGVRVLKHPQNRGKGAALVTGLSQARALGWEWAITLDADGQHAPEDLEGFRSARPGPRVGILNGCRARRGSRMPWHRRFSNASTTALVSRLAGTPVFDAQCGYRAYRLEILEALPEGGRFEWEAQALILAARAGWEIEKVPVRTVYAGEGSHMRLFADTLRFVRMAYRMSRLSRIPQASRSSAEGAWTR